MADLKPLIAYLIDQVREKEGAPNKTALVKLVYLVDVECCRRFGKPATGLEWRFHHYGPYSAELEQNINDNAFIDVFGNRRSGYSFSISSEWNDIHAAVNTHFGPRVKRIADEVIRQWGLEPLDTLLEYVYFETEPMQDARRGTILDFSVIQPEERTIGRGPRLAFSDEFINDLRARWDQRIKAANTSSREQDVLDEPLYDEIYEEALELMAEEEGMRPQTHRRYRLEGPHQERTS